MKPLRCCAFLLAALLLVLPAWAQVKPDPGFTALFDGSSLNGWSHSGDGSITLEHGELVTHHGMGLLWYTRRKFTNYILRVVYRQTSYHDNSGVYIKIGPGKPVGKQGAMYGVNHGYEAQIDDTDDSYHRTGCIYSLAPCPKDHIPWQDWHTMEIRVVGHTIDVYLNGRHMSHFVETQPVPPKKESWEPDRHLRPLSGYIGLQNDNDDQGRDNHVHFRLVEIKELP